MSRRISAADLAREGGDRSFVSEDGGQTWEDQKDRARRLKLEWGRKRQEQLRRTAKSFGIDFVFRDGQPPYGPLVARCTLVGQPWPAVDWWLTSGSVREVVPRTVVPPPSTGYARDVQAIGELLRTLKPRVP